MLHEAIFLATCLATMTTEKHCKLQRGCHTFALNIFSQLATPPLEIVYNSFSASLKSPGSKRRALIVSFSQNCVAGCDGHVTRSNLSRNVAKRLRIFLLFLQLATQHFVAVASCKLVLQQKVARKIASWNMAFSEVKNIFFGMSRQS